MQRCGRWTLQENRGGEDRQKPADRQGPTQPADPVGLRPPAPAQRIIDQHAITAPGVVITPKIGASENVIPEPETRPRVMTPTRQTRTVRIVVSRRNHAGRVSGPTRQPA